MLLAVALQLAGVVCVVVGVLMLFGAGWSLVAGGVGVGAVGWTLEQGQHARAEDG